MRCKQKSLSASKYNMSNFPFFLCQPCFNMPLCYNFIVNNVQGAQKMIKKENIKSYIHYSMSVSGGFFGVYAILNHLDIFASSQTSNFIHIFASLFGRNWYEMLFRLGAALLYISAIVLSSLLVKRTRLNMRLYSPNCEQHCRALSDIFLHGNAVVHLQRRRGVRLLIYILYQ